MKRFMQALWPMVAVAAACWFLCNRRLWFCLHRTWAEERMHRNPNRPS